ncbi:MAG: TetR family transcriptional regulator [Streptosporangiales bacterium]|jgi:AcrR family transcriptional regulator|nr:TetR family transcriptional regulator [Streptosporangiales bacterium]
MSKKPARDRLAEAAFDLFDERGYEQTTVDDITERAGLGRTTFFRYYRSKEDVIFPDHDRLLEQMAERLSATSSEAGMLAVSDAVRVVMVHYLQEGKVARRRYALTSRVPALRDREIVSTARYQRLFSEFIAAWLTDNAGYGRSDSDRDQVALQAEVIAAAMVAAHNHVLRRWLRGQVQDPLPELDKALGRVIKVFAIPGLTPAGDGSSVGATDDTAVIAFRTSTDLDTLISSLKRIVGS